MPPKEFQKAILYQFLNGKINRYPAYLECRDNLDSTYSHENRSYKGQCSALHFQLISMRIRVLFSSVQCSRSVVSDSATPWTAARQASLSITNSRSLLKLMSIESMMPSNHLILCLPLFHLPSIFPSIVVFSSELALCIRWPKYLSFSFNISPSNEYSGLISFGIEWFDLFAVHGILKSLL